MPWLAAPRIALEIVLDLIGMVVRLTVDLDREAGIAAVEIE